MTLQQLRYVITVAETGTITEAAQELYISQPSLTNAIHELEKEMNIQIFNRSNKGISISKEGEDFLGYARQVLEQAAILEDKYKGSEGGKKQFCVSTQHYSFAVNAFVDLFKANIANSPILNFMEGDAATLHSGINCGGIITYSKDGQTHNASMGYRAKDSNGNIGIVTAGHFISKGLWWQQFCCLFVRPFI